MHPHLDGRTLARTVFDAARARHVRRCDDGPSRCRVQRRLDAVLSSKALSLKDRALRRCATCSDRSTTAPASTAGRCTGRPRTWSTSLRCSRVDRRSLRTKRARRAALAPARSDRHRALVHQHQHGLAAHRSCARDPRAAPYTGRGAPAQQTTWVAAELRSARNIGSRLRTTAAQAVFPWRLPFDLATERMRAYFQQLGCTRLAAMRRCSGDAGGLLEPAGISSPKHSG